VSTVIFNTHKDCETPTTKEPRDQHRLKKELYILFRDKNVYKYIKRNSRRINTQNGIRISIVHSIWTCPCNIVGQNSRHCLKNSKNCNRTFKKHLPWTCKSHLTLILYSLQLGHAYNFKTFLTFFSLIIFVNFVTFLLTIGI